MSKTQANIRKAAGKACPAGGGEMGALIRSMDWSKTPLGPVEGWPQPLRTMVPVLLQTRFPMLICWGPELIQLYNDAYRPILGSKHPASMGQPARECWAEIWFAIGPMMNQQLQGGPASWDEDLHLELNRYGFVEETYFTFSYSPIPIDTSGVSGVLVTVTETTPRVLNERRVTALRDLGVCPAQARSGEAACVAIAETLADHARDVPFALLYLIDPGGATARLAATAGVAASESVSPNVIALNESARAGWPLFDAVRLQTAQTVENLASHFTEIPAGPWSEPPHTALVMPIPSNQADELTGLLIAGASPRLALDEHYRGFFELLTAQTATAINNARAYETERKRAEALAEIDRAKTAFFSNVSHEFRTPLTLMLGPVEDALDDAASQLPETQRGRLEVAHRNALRLLKLVNSLLDFSRIEAGRAQASYEPTDLAALTADLASQFRSACEKANLRLIVDCPPLAEPVYVDRDLWEKIVLNLLSNAFKFTFEGEIEVRLRATPSSPTLLPEGEGSPDSHPLLRGEGSIELLVRDTGAGIPAQELPRLFERFYRVEGARARTHEGAGIGLALVQELVRLHGGEIRADSTPDQGSEFRVTLPLGAAHLPPERIGGARTLASTATDAAAYVEEALRWLPEGQVPSAEGRGLNQEWASPSHSALSAQSSALTASVLIADDNADMRGYLQRLLSEYWRVETVADGAAALEAARRNPPDLVLADVMMPGLDGFGLLKALRAESRTAAIPIILLSARAGEEARTEGLEAGADDYLVKPFSARELLACVRGHIELARLRRTAAQSERRAERILESISDSFYAVDDQWRFIYINHAAEGLWGRRREELLGRNLWEEFPQATGSELSTRLIHAMKTRRGARFETVSPILRRWIAANVYPAEDGGLSVYFQDIEARKQTAAGHNRLLNELELERDRLEREIVEREGAELKLTDTESRLMALFKSNVIGVIWGEDDLILDANEAFFRLTGYSPAELPLEWSGMRPPDERGRDGRAVKEAIITGRYAPYERTLIRTDGSRVPVILGGHCFGTGPFRHVSFVLDLSSQKQAEAQLRHSEERFRSLVTATASVVWHADPQGTIIGENGQWQAFTGQTPEQYQNWGWLDTLHPDDAEAATRIWKVGLRDKAPVETECRLKQQDGEYRYAAVRGVPIMDDSGAVREWVGTVSDIHERKQIEQALALSVVRYRSLVDATSAIVWSANPQGAVIEEAAEWRKFTGQTLAQCRGDGWLEAVHPEERRLAKQIWDRTLRDKTQTGAEYRLKRADGEYRYVAVRYVPIHDLEDELREWVCSVSDITERRIEERQREFFLNLNETIRGLSSPAEIVEAVAQAACEHLGVSQCVYGLRDPDEKHLSVEQESCGVKNSVGDIDRLDDLGAKLAARLRRGETLVINDTAKDPRTAGKAAKTLAAAGARALLWAPLLKRGRIEALLAVQHEHPRVWAEHEISLVEKLAQRTWRVVEQERAEAQLREQKEALTKADKAKDEFLAMLAHELRNPLTPIHNAVQLMKRRSEPLDDKLQWSFDVIARQTGHITRLVDDLLDVARITRGRIELQRKPVELAAVINAAAETVRPLIDSLGHDLELVLPQQSLRVDGDADRLDQIVVNLLNNAAKYTPEGGRIEVILSKDANQAVIRVRDTGIGIALDMLPRLFEVFSQAERSLDRSQGGLGLGLTLVRQLTGMHGGSVEARSHGPDQGSEFTVRLPLIDAAAIDTTRQKTERDKSNNQTLRILVVDDNADVSQGLLMLLEELGHEARAAHDGAAALRAVEQFAPRVVLLDIGLPGMSGFEVAQKLREGHDPSQLTLIALTGYGDEETLRRAREAGFDHHLLKPAGLESLEDLLGEV